VKLLRRLVSLPDEPSLPEEPNAPADEPGAQEHALAPLTAEETESLTRYLGTSPRDGLLYAQALTHRSILRVSSRHDAESNERLEFLGDALLGALVAEYLYEHFPERNEGFLTRLRARLVSGRALAKVAARLGLGEIVRLSPNMDRSGGRTNATILADAFEAVLAALYLDRGAEAARTFVHQRHLAHADVEALASVRENHKSTLLEHAQAQGWAQPTYHTVEETGPSHDKTFRVEVVVEGEVCGSGTASSKKRAEQYAAEEALEVLRGDA
jgi:ribonuclease-3